MNIKNEIKSITKELDLSKKEFISLLCELKQIECIHNKCK